MFCKNCGTEILDDSAFCPKCGTSVNAGANPPQTNNTYNQESSSNNNGPVILNYEPGMDYNPISMWGYFGYGLLFSIPIIGFILAIVFSFGGTKNINLRNYQDHYSVHGLLVLFCLSSLEAVQWHFFHHCIR